MIVGLGTDIVDVPRFTKILSRHQDRFCGRVFTPAEMEYCWSKANAAERFAARFAAKEAVMKALGTGWSGGISWTQIEVIHTSSGAPELHLSGPAAVLAKTRGVGKMWVSLTHTALMAAAFVVFES